MVACQPNRDGSRESAAFKIEDCKVYVPVVTLSAENYNKLLEQLKIVFKITINPILVGEGGGVKSTPLPPQAENGKNGKNRQAAGLSGLFTKQNLVFDVS